MPEEHTRAFAEWSKELSQLAKEKDQAMIGHTLELEPSAKREMSASVPHHSPLLYVESGLREKSCVF